MGRKFVHKNIHILNTGYNLTNNQQIISNSFNDHILSTADRINNKISKNLNSNRNNSIPMEYLLKTFKNFSQILNIIIHHGQKLKIFTNLKNQLALIDMEKFLFKSH